MSDRPERAELPDDDDDLLDLLDETADDEIPLSARTLNPPPEGAR